MNYSELKALFCKHEADDPDTHLTVCITFSSFGPENTKEYSWESRTYVVSSDNKAFQPNKGGYSIFGSCLDGTDRCVRLEAYMAEERGGKNGWVVEECCIVGYMLMEHSDCGIETPRIVFTMEMAQQEMLSRIAEFLGIDPDPLRKEYRRSNCEITGDCFYAKKDNAHASTIKCSDSWQIRPLYIRSLLDITVGHGQ